MTGSSGKFSSRCKGVRNKSTTDMIKNLLIEYGSLSQNILTIKGVLKDPIFSAKSDYTAVINIENVSPIIVNLLSEIKNKNNDFETSNINTRQRVKNRGRLISKAGSNCSIDQEEFYFSNDGKKCFTVTITRQAKSRTTKDIIEYILKLDTHKKNL